MDRFEDWAAALLTELPDLDLRSWPEVGDPADIDVALVWHPPRGELAGYPNLRAILSLGAGVDGILADPGLPDVPLVRMLDPGLTAGMTEYVTAATLRYHRNLDVYGRTQATGRWVPRTAPAAEDRRVGVLGLGELGGDAARAFARLGFDTEGWSRTPKQIEGVRCRHGPEGLDALLARTEILVCLLPLTEATADILDARLFARLPQGACVINVARGGHLVENDLLAALDSGRLAGATLDVFRTEPLPPDHPFWRHERILVTPHVASMTPPRSAARLVAANIRRLRAGAPLEGLVDRRRGY
jgi:glyoxylate/hydroxypyruvate reductase A